MGITIHFRGKLKNTNIINDFVDELIDISDTLNWDYDILDEDWTEPSNATLFENENGMEITGYLSLKGIGIKMHPDCEKLDLYFDSEGNLISPIYVALMNEGVINKDTSFNSVKTQFAPPDVHISIITLLKYLKKQYLPNLKVVDEGEYWESEDREKLKKNMMTIDNAMDILEVALSEIDAEEMRNGSSGQLADILEKKLKQM